MGCANNKFINDSTVFFSDGNETRLIPFTFTSLTPVEKDLLCTSLLIEINQARTFPVGYVPIVEKYANKINYEKGVVKVSQNSAVVIKEGKNAFDSCIEFLKQQKPLNALQKNEALTIKFPKKIEECVQVEYLESVVKKKCEELSASYGDSIVLKKFHFDVCSVNAEASCVMQIVDDTLSGQTRRKNIFNEEVNIACISCDIVSKGVICFYVALGTKS